MFATALTIALKGKPLSWWAFALLTAVPAAPPDEVAAFWLFNPANRAALTATARDAGLLWADELAGWEVDPPDLTGTVGAIYVLRCRATGDPLPYPDDPKGPRPIR